MAPKGAVIVQFVVRSKKVLDVVSYLLAGQNVSIQ